MPLRPRSKPRETSRDYAHPHRPTPIAWMNRALEFGERIELAGRLAPIEADAMVELAQRRTGLDDFGAPPHGLAGFRPALLELCRSIQAEAQLHPLGHFIQHVRLVDALSTRLRIEDLYRRHPEIEDVVLGPVCVIAGPQRSGTTKLHRLLAADPQTRALRSWEALNPAPLPFERVGPGATESHRRVRRARLAQRALAYMAPDFFAVHPVEYDAPEEDILLLDLCFMTQTPEATMHVPSYARWLEQQDHVPAYRYLERVLKLLQWQSPGARWVLKTPHHMEHLDALLAVFPRATVVRTHRDPLETTASFCSMVAHSRGVFSDQVDPQAVARHWVRKVARMGRAAEAAQQRHPERFVHVRYSQLLDAPLAEVSRIYEHMGLRLGTDAEDAMRAAERAAPQHRYGKHRYALEDFGMDAADIERELGFMRLLDPDTEEHRRNDADDPQAAPASTRASGTESAEAAAAEGPTGVGHQNPLRATLTGLWDLARPGGSGTLEPLDPEIRLDGRRILITGATAGLGLATARALARRGADLVLVGRGQKNTDVAEELARAYPRASIRPEAVELADLDSVRALCDRLEGPFDAVICNAGMMPSSARRSPQGFELMFAVHVLANRVLLGRMLARGLLTPAEPGSPMPRVVIVSSEAHRSADATPIEALGQFEAFGMRDGMKHYGRSKHALCALATALDLTANAPARERGEPPWLGVHTLCPGPVASKIAREAPRWVRPLLDPVMRRAFRAPESACEPVLLLAASPSLEGRSGQYLHMLRPKAMAASASAPRYARALWRRTGQLAGEPT